MADKVEFREPTGEDAAGYRTYTPSKSAYECFMEEEGIPIYRGIGVRDTRELELGDWKRTGGKGMFLALEGLEGLKGMYVLEIPPRGRSQQRLLRYRQLRAAAGQPARAGVPPHPALFHRLHGRCDHRRIHRSISKRPLLEGSLSPLGRGAGVPAGQGLHLQLAGR